MGKRFRRLLMTTGGNRSGIMELLSLLRFGSGVEKIENMTMVIWPVEIGSLSIMDVGVDSGTDITYWIDYGNTDIEEMFIADYTVLHDWNVTYPEVGTYEVTVTLHNTKSFLSMVGYAEVDINITDLVVSTNHTEFGQPTWVNVSASAGTRITTFWIMGNGNGMENYATNFSTISELEYPMMNMGFYEMEIRVSNSLFYYYETQLIAVVKRITNFDLAVNHVNNLTTQVDWVRTLTDGSNMTCVIDYGDGEMFMTHEQEPSLSKTYSHTYNTIGIYFWTCVCSNFLHHYELDGNITVQVPITDFTTNSEVILFLSGGDFTLSWSVTAGTNLTFEVNMTRADDPSISLTDVGTLNFDVTLDGTFVLTENDYSAGDWVAVITGYNEVSREIKTVAISIDRMILNLSLTSNVLYQVPNEVITFYIDILDGSRTAYDLDNGDGSSAYSTAQIADSNMGGQHQHSVNRTFAGIGYFTVTATVNNSVGFVVQTLDIGIEWPVYDCEVATTNATDNLTDTTVTITHGTNAPTSAIVFIDYMYDEVTLEEALSTVSPVVINQALPYYMIYVFNITLYNNVSSISFSPEVMVGVEIEGANIVIVGSNCAPPIPLPGTTVSDTPISFQVSVVKGSNVEYQIHYGDGNSSAWTPRTTTDWTQPDSLYISYTYPYSGDFDVQLSVRNNLTEGKNQINVTGISVNIEDPFAGYSWNTLPTQKLNDTCTTTFTLTRDTDYAFPTDAQCTYSFDDGITETVAVPNTNAQIFNYSHFYNITHGPRTITINCSNCVAQQTFTREVMFHRAIIRANASSTNYTVEVDAPADVLFSVDAGSHLNVSVDFWGNGTWNVNEFYETPAFMNNIHTTYATTFPEGNYTCIIYLFNDVSSANISCNEKHIIQYRVPQLHLSVASHYKVNVPGGNVTVGIVVDQGAPIGPTDAFCIIHYDTGSSQTTYAGPLREKRQHNDTFHYTITGVQRMIRATCYNFINIVDVPHEYAQLEEGVASCNLTLIPTSADRVVARTNQSLTFKVTCVNGTGANAFLNFGDGNVTEKTMHESALGFPWAYMYPAEYHHNYSSPMNLTLQLKVNNTVSSANVSFPSTPLIIQNPVPNISVTLTKFFIACLRDDLSFVIALVKNSSARGPTDPRIDTHIEMTEINATGTGESFYYNPKIEFDNDNQLIDNELAFPGQEPLPTDWIGAGKFYVNVSNLVSWQHVVVDFQVEQVIETLVAYTNNSLIRINEPFTLNIKAEKGTHMHFNIYLDDNNPSMVEMVNPQKLNSTMIFSVPGFNYSVSGNYTIKVFGHNNVSNTTEYANTTQIVMAPVDPLVIDITNLNDRGKIPSIPGVINISICIDLAYRGDHYSWPPHVYMNWTVKDDSSGYPLYHDYQSTNDPCFHHVHTLDGFTHGDLLVYVECGNAVSKTNLSKIIQVVQVTDSPIITANCEHQATNSPVFFQCASGKGSNLTITINYKDGSAPVSREIPGLIESTSVNFTHQFETPGNYSVTCNFTNDVSGNSTTLAPALVIQIPVLETELELLPNAEHLYLPYPPGDASWTLTHTGADAPSDVHVTLGADSKWYIPSFTDPYDFTSRHNGTGTVNLTFSIYNLVSNIYVNRLITFQQPISGVLYTRTPFVRARSNQSFVCTRETGSHVNTTFSWNADISAQYQEGYQHETQTVQRFETAGMYETSCKMCNDLSCETTCETCGSDSYDMLVLNPVISVYVENTYLVEAGSEIQVKVMGISDVSEPVTPVSRANATVDFGDNRTTLHGPEDFDEKFFAHTYESDGIFKINVTLYNEISTIWNHSDIEARWTIMDLDIVLPNITGHGPGPHPVIPKGTSLKIHANYSQGSSIMFNWTLISPSGTTQYLSSEPTVDIPFNNPGAYNIRLYADNVLSNAEITKKIIVKAPLKVTKFESPSAKSGYKMDKEQSCTVQLQEKVEKICFKIAFTSNKSISVALPTIVVGTSVDDCPSDVQAYFKELDMQDQENQPALEPEYVFNFTITSEVDPLFINLTVYSNDATDVGFLSTTVLSEPCAKPQMSIKEGEGQSIVLPKIVKKREEIVTLRQINFNIFVSCEANHTVIDFWQLYAHNNNESETEPLQVADGAKLEIQVKDLDYGNYFASFTRQLRLKNDYRLTGRANYFLQIDPSELLVQFASSSMRVGETEGLDLSADVDDPDEQVDPFVYKWSCTTEGSACKVENGCFGTGPGELDLEAINANGDVLILQDNTLAYSGELSSKCEYTFSLTASKGIRLKEASIIVNAVKGNPPPLEVDCDVNCDGKVNPEKKHKSCPKCKNCKKGEYTWSVKKAEVDVPFEMDGDCIIIQPQENVGEYEHQCITLEARLNITKLPEALVAIKWNTADRPKNGKCEVQPANGVGLSTRFTISCSGWIDRSESEEPCSLISRRRKRSTANSPGLSFKYQYQTDSAEDLVSIPTTTPTFPAGLEKNDFKITVITTITNKYGLSSSFEIRVTVNNPPAGAVGNAVETFVQTGNPADDFASLAAMSSMIGSTPDEGGEDNSQEDALLLAKIMNNMANLLDNDPDPATLVAMISMVSATTKKQQPGVVSASDGSMSLIVELGKSIDKLPPSEVASFGEKLLASMGQTAENFDLAPTPPPVPPPDLEGVPDEEAEEAEAERRRQEELQRQQNQKDVATTMQASTKNMVASLSQTLIENEKITVGHKDLQVTVVKKTINNLSGTNFTLPGGKVTLPEMVFNGSGDSIVIFDVTFSKTNIFSWSASAKDVTSGITMMDMTFEDGEEAPFGELKAPMDLTMQQKGGKDNYANMANATIDQFSNLIYLYVPVDETVSAYVMEVGIDDFETSEDLYFEVYVKFNASETVMHRPNATEGQYDYNATMPDTQRWHAWILIIPESLVGPPGISIGLLPRIRDDPVPMNTTPAFDMASALTRCRSWNYLDEEWTTESCTVNQDGTTLDETLCSCTKLDHYVKTFAGGITMPQVNTIDFSAIFNNFSALLAENPIVMATIIVIFVFYFLLLVWARRKDKQDTEKWGVTPLVDNLPDSSLFYKLSVYTGLRQKAGTQSKICFILAGDKGDTGVRVLDDGRGKHYDRGTVRHFIMSINQDLGPLNYVRVWHDNSGEGPLASWFLDKVTVEDLQRKTSRWLAADEDDGQVDRSLPVAGDEEIDGFDHIFFSSARRNLTDEHLWISVLSRPTKSNFTRAQRLTCCLTLLYTTMLASAMWYKTDEEDTGQDQVVRLGPIIFSVQGLIISIFSNLVVIPANLIIVQLFRKSKPRYYVDMAVAKAAKKEQDKRKKYVNANLGEIQKKEIEDGKNATVKEEKKKKKFKLGKYPLPWWCIYISWTFSLSLCGVCAFIVLFYSLEWGRYICEMWLSSLLFSFVQSVMIVQPIKVVAVAMILSCIFKKYNDEEENDDLNQAKLLDDEEPLDLPSDINTLTAPAPPTVKDLRAARQKSAKEKRMWATLREALVYLLFLLLVAFIAWGPRDSNMYGTVSSIKNLISGEQKKYGPNQLETQGFLGDGFRFWLWVNTTVVEALYNTRIYNGQPSTRRDRKYISDGVSFRVGPVRLRQLRARPAECEVTDIMRPFVIECNVGYAITTEEDRNYTAGWAPETIANGSVALTEIDKPFRYFSMMDLKGFPLWGYLSTFGGGGYVADLSTSPRRARRAINQLIKYNWLDYYTRAVFLEFTIYNPNTNLFSHTSYLVEFPTTGGALPMAKTQCFQVYSALGTMGTAVLVAQIIYILVMLYFIYREVKEFRQKGRAEYFADPWNIYEIIVIVASIVCIAMFAMKEVFGKLVTKQLKDNKDGYSSYLQLATYIELVDYTVAFIVFMANIKFLRLLRFNTHVRELGKTIHTAGKELLYFGASFFIMYSGFTLSATMLFGSFMYDYSNYLQTLQALYAIILGAADFHGMRTAQPILGPVFFFVYLVLVFFILVNMFVTILTNAYAEVRLQAKQEEDEFISFFMHRFKSAVGVKVGQGDIGTGYVEPADLLDKRIDSINAWINQYYKDEAQAKKASKVQKPVTNEKPLEGESHPSKSGWNSMFSF